LAYTGTSSIIFHEAFFPSTLWRCRH